VNADFLEASSRHFIDAEHLYGLNRAPNAGQLYGFCAECGVKALLIAFGLATDPDGDLAGTSATLPYKKHMNALIASLTVFPAHDRTYFRYLSMMPDLVAFTDWKVDHRYYKEAAIPPSHASWRVAATQVRAMLAQAQIEGRIP
jgi:hypothetical protein